MNRLNLLKRLEKLENRFGKDTLFVFVMGQHFKSFKALNKEISKLKYKGATIIIDDLSLRRSPEEIRSAKLNDRIQEIEDLKKHDDITPEALEALNKLLEEVNNDGP